MSRFLLALLWIVLSFTFVEAQGITETQARKELEKRGIDESRFREEMLKKGINLDNLDPNNPQELMRVEKEVREVILMLEKEKVTKAGNKKDGPAPVVQEDTKNKQLEDSKTINKDNKDIIEKVKDGASLEEAVTEKLQDKQAKALPRASIYGQQIFRDNSLSLFRTAEGAKPPRNYVLGPGDVVSIAIFGNSELSFTQEISKEGFIKMDREPRYYISGLTVDDAEKLLFKNLRNHYVFDSGSFAFSVNTARTINVNIFGEVFNNGTFTISALNSAFNALVASGGPTDYGSVRNIKLLRGKEVKKLDVYKYLSNPVISEDLYLQENDFIHVPVADMVVSIDGAIIRPYKYELIDGENLKDLIRYCGGLKANALKRNITITRYESDAEKKYSVNYSDIESGVQKFDLRNGDVVHIDTITEVVNNIVQIVGAVSNPGAYAFEKGMRLSDLLKVGKLTENAITDLAYIRRFNPDRVTVKYEIINLEEAIQNSDSPANIELSKGDILTVRASGDFVDRQEASVNGFVRLPGKISLSFESGLKVADAIFLSGGLKDNATDFAYVFRKKQKKDNAIEYIYVDLAKALSDKTSPSNIDIQPRDSIVVYSKADYENIANVIIGGAVRKPGKFIYHANLTIKDLILLAGGFNIDAATNRVDVFRIDINKENKTKTLAAKLSINPELDDAEANFPLMPFDQIYVRTAPEFELQNNVTLLGEVVYPGQYSMIKENTRISDIISQSGGLTEEASPDNATLYRTKDDLGFIVINLKEALKNKGSFSDIILQSGDELEIPKRSAVVSIEGATKYQGPKTESRQAGGRINVTFEGEKSAKYYIDKYAAGFDEKADVKRLIVKHSNGKVDKVKRVLFWKVYPDVKEGSLITVPYKEEKALNADGQQEKSIDWGDVLKDSITQATAILSLILLIQSVN